MNKLLLDTKPIEGKGVFDIIHLTERGDFKLDIFNNTSCMHVISTNKDKRVVLPQRLITKCPRVGLSHKSYDAEKAKYWLADYRFTTFPACITKLKDYLVLSYLAKGGKTFARIGELTGAKIFRIEDLNNHFLSG